MLFRSEELARILRDYGEEPFAWQIAGRIVEAEDSRPELGGEPLDMKDYDIVFLGYPIWWDLCPRPVNTFLEKYDFSGKTVIPFATSGGSSIAHSVRQLRKLYPNVIWNDGKLLNGGVAVATEWAKQVVENGKKESR